MVIPTVRTETLRQTQKSKWQEHPALSVYQSQLRIKESNLENALKLQSNA